MFNKSVQRKIKFSKNQTFLSFTPNSFLFTLFKTVCFREQQQWKPPCRLQYPYPHCFLKANLQECKAFTIFAHTINETRPF